MFHKKMLAVVVSDVEVDDEYQFERRMFGSNPNNCGRWPHGCSSKPIVSRKYSRLTWAGTLCVEDQLNATGNTQLLVDSD
jgi:hypothetical protein